MKVQKYQETRYWAVYDENDELVCVTVYRKGAMEVARRLTYTNLELPLPSDNSQNCKMLKIRKHLESAAKLLKALPAQIELNTNN